MVMPMRPSACERSSRKHASRSKISKPFGSSSSSVHHPQQRRQRRLSQLWRARQAPIAMRAGSVAAGDPPDVAHLGDELRVSVAFVCEGFEHGMHEHHVELVRRRGP